ncbi:Nmad2 family putative nucleotide modification protein [Modestobacter sp. SYSU DS0875]
MRLYSYVVRYDIGFAPNPFHGWCTLATCKQDIRGKAQVGDWIVGTGSREQGLGDRLVYAMRVEETLGFDSYWTDPRFRRKRPNLRGSLKYVYGDNIYHRGPDGGWVQENSRHSLDDGSPNHGHVARDTKADAVLVARQFAYFGGRGPVIPHELRHGYGMDLVHGRPSYRVNFPDKLRDAVIDWVCSDLDQGLQADPRDW